MDGIKNLPMVLSMPIETADSATSSRKGNMITVIRVVRSSWPGIS